MLIIRKESPKLCKNSDFSIAEKIVGRNYPRKELITCLLAYNKAIGNDSIALQNIEKLKEGFCVFTGQQAGLFGGPAYTILKAISCLLLAKETNAIPIFWLATEDHDIDEIDHTYLLDQLGNLQKIHLTLPKDGRMPEDLTFDPNNLDTSFSNIDINERSYSLFHAKFLAKLFQGTGLVFVEPRNLRKLAKPFFVKEINESDQIQEVLQQSASKLEAPRLDLSRGTNLFYKIDGKYRSKIVQEGQDFFIGKKKYTKEKILNLIDTEPNNFSADVKARCVLQSLLFPTIAYVAGPNEINYYQQLKEYHEFHGVTMPSIVPRMSATFINRQAKTMLEKLKLNPWDEIPSHYSSIFPEIEDAMESFTADLLKVTNDHLGQEVAQVTINHYIHSLAKKFKRKLTMELLKKQGLPSHSLHYLKNLIHPHNTAQERIFNWFEFQRHTDENLISELLAQADWKFNGHYYCFI